MGNYLTVTEVKSRFADKVDELYYDTDLSAINDDWIGYDIDESEAVVDSYVGTRYDVPIVANQTQINALKGWTYTLFQGKAYERRLDSEVPESIRDKIKEVYKLLNKIASGTIPLAGDRAPENDAASQAGLDVEAGTTYYNAEDTEGW